MEEANQNMELTVGAILEGKVNNGDAIKIGFVDGQTQIKAN